MSGSTILAAMRGASSRDQPRWMVAGDLKRETDKRARYLMSQGPACPDFCSLVPGPRSSLATAAGSTRHATRWGPSRHGIYQRSSSAVLPFPSDRVIA